LGGEGYAGKEGGRGTFGFRRRLDEKLNAYTGAIKKLFCGGAGKEINLKKSAG